MMISIDQRLVTAASLVWETFSDQDAQDYYWNSTLSLSARMRETAISAGTLIHFLCGVQAWLRGLDYEEIEQYQKALPAAPTPKLLGAVPVALDAIDFWEG